MANDKQIAKTHHDEKKHKHIKKKHKKYNINYFNNNNDNKIDHTTKYDNVIKTPCDFEKECNKNIKCSCDKCNIL